MESQIHLVEGNQLQTSSTEKQTEAMGLNAAGDLPAAAIIKKKLLPLVQVPFFLNRMLVKTN